MSLLKKCWKCNKYTLKDKCSICLEKTKEAHYKYKERFVKKIKT